MKPIRELIQTYCTARANVRVAVRSGAPIVIMTELQGRADALGAELGARLAVIERYIGDGLTDAGARNAAMTALDGRAR